MSLRTLLDRAMLLALRLVRRPGEPEGVLLVTARGPAEMVFLSAVLPRFLRLAGEGEPVTLLCRPDAAGMAFLFPRALKLKRLDFRTLSKLPVRWRVFRGLYRANYRLAVSLDHRYEAEGEALCAATDAAGRGCIKGAGRMGPFTRVVDVGPPGQDKILRWSRYADDLLDDRQLPQLALVTGAALPEPMALPPTVVAFPFSAVRLRQLPVATWAAIIAALPHGWQVRVAGHQKDFDRNPEYAALLKLPNVAAETHDFERLASILRGSRFAIGADTAGLHLAALLGVPTLCLASAAYVGAGVPYDERVAPAHVHFLYAPLPCQGCRGHCPFPAERGMYPCVAALDDGTVVGAVRDALARGAP